MKGVADTDHRAETSMWEPLPLQETSNSNHPVTKTRNNTLYELQTSFKSGHHAAFHVGRKSRLKEGSIREGVQG
jgi:hypothetical protein